MPDITEKGVDNLISPEPIISEPFAVQIYGKDNYFCFRELTLAEEQDCQRKGMIWAGVQKCRIESAIKQEVGDGEPFQGWSTYGMQFDEYTDHRTELERLCLAIVDTQYQAQRFPDVKSLEDTFTPEQISSIALRFTIFVSENDPDNITAEDIQTFIDTLKKNTSTDGEALSREHYSLNLLLASCHYLAGEIQELEAELAQVKAQEDTRGT